MRTSPRTEISSTGRELALARRRRHCSPFLPVVAAEKVSDPNLPRLALLPPNPHPPPPTSSTPLLLLAPRRLATTTATIHAPVPRTSQRRAGASGQRVRRCQVGAAEQRVAGSSNCHCFDGREGRRNGAPVLVFGERGRVLATERVNRCVEGSRVREGERRHLLSRRAIDNCGRC